MGSEGKGGKESGSQPMGHRCRRHTNTGNRGNQKKPNDAGPELGKWMVGVKA